jgi:branched-chain amino acid transport system substrate-binding protein
MGRVLARGADLRLVTVILLLGGLLWLTGCAPSSQQDVSSEQKLSGKDQEQAEKLYSQMRREFSLHRDRKTLEIAANLLDYYPAFARNDEVLAIAMDSATRLEDLGQARNLGDELLNRYPMSPLVDQTLLTVSELALAEEDTFSAVGYQLRYHNRDPLRSTRSNGMPACEPYLTALDGTELGLLMDREMNQPLWSYLGYLRTNAYLQDGLYPQAEDVVAELNTRDQTDQWAIAATDLLTGGVSSAGGVLRHRTLVQVNMDQIGVLCPLSGRYAVLGNAFYDGAIQALNAANKETGRNFILKVEDTGGDSVGAALAARRLCSQDGCGVLFGALMSHPTTATALVADIYGVPLLSPTATSDRIWEIGDGIFQTNLTGLHEVRLLAQLATSVLLKERFAIIHENTPEGERHAQVFVTEVEKFGGQVVAVESYNLADTDFRKPILAMKEARPEVIFTPATVDQMILLAPQLDFYKAGALVMGLSNWNSERLYERTGTVLERTIFPSNLTLFPGEWTGDFHAEWKEDNYPREATLLALKSYQSMRLLLDTLDKSGANSRVQLQDALMRRLANRDIEADGPESFSNTVRIFRNERAVSFPSYLFTESWALTDGASVDSLLTEESGSLDLEPWEEESLGEE